MFSSTPEMLFSGLVAERRIDMKAKGWYNNVAKSSAGIPGTAGNGTEVNRLRNVI